jgi:hypothetical protein
MTSSVLSSNGLRLVASINGTNITVGRKLNITVFISNTLSTVNTVHPASDWPFQRGVPAGVWPAFYFDWPIHVVIPKGNYTAQELPSVVNVTFRHTCAEGITVEHIIFQPNSDEVKLTGIYQAGSTSNETLGPYRLQLNFTTRGYWDLQSLSQEVNPPILGDQYGTGALPSISLLVPWSIHRWSGGRVGAGGNPVFHCLSTESRRINLTLERMSYFTCGTLLTHAK